ncbi:MAG: Crp/Fnr family transcriptional regulator [Kofleriaceae bacterium]|jgi:CRP/FNR family cyclic AMP-dependent transcriptional regulator|nr:Crp/Fnr family transcriptional regulator [Kofleriaceae bacterium]MBP6838204.1 Crp/Fnr family transcriptional regulator [Kofleriaceae bacterium]MBP9208133.1 Crp/Fnr family transcriptional regulator [Kofleriaceae bacterium]
MADVLERFATNVPAGTVLFREGEAGEVMFVIQSGEVEIHRRIGEHDRVLAVLGPGEFFGEMALLSGRPRSASAVVRTTARLVSVTATTLDAMLRGRPEIALRMIKSLTGRLDRANQQIELLLLASPNHRVVVCLRQLADEAGAGGRAEGSIHLTVGLDEIARRVALPVAEVTDILQRLASARLVMFAAEAGLDGPGLILPEVGRLLEFLEFLEIKERYRAALAPHGDPPERR